MLGSCEIITEGVAIRACSIEDGVRLVKPLLQSLNGKNSTQGRETHGRKQNLERRDRNVVALSPPLLFVLDFKSYEQANQVQPQQSSLRISIEPFIVNRNLNILIC